ncbi:NAD-dependent DNA ligase LigA [Candidatus Magnetoovum chiemensis]|nr:NAD-dependent DNA ligase LigA [Candidatus Magnetoovum chiemensis]
MCSTLQSLNSSSMSEIESEIAKLVKELNYHNYRYHVLESPEISDSQYDALFRRLEELETQTGCILPHSPTQRVGAVAEERFAKVEHRIPMLSLDDTFSFSELVEFDKRVKKLLNNPSNVEYTVEPKYDGLAIELTYINGLLTRASTRGDGYTGEDVTNNVRTIRSIPLRIESSDKIPDEIDIRGEIYMNINDFKALNKTRQANNEPLFANPRNASSGSIRQLDPAVTAARKINIACYGIGFISGIELGSQTELIAWLRQNRLPVAVEFSLAKDIDEAIEFIKRIKDKKDSFPFYIDGAVVKVNDFKLRESLGFKSRSPRWAAAFKYEANQGVTVVKEIIASVGRTGVITPVALLEPIRIGGVNVSRSTLHNWEEVIRKDIRTGDRVLVERAGDVIPYIVKALDIQDRQPLNISPLPKNCPVCGALVEKDEAEVAVRCIGLNCPAQAQERIRHFAARSAMNIEGLGVKNVELFYNQGLIKNFVAIFNLKKDNIKNLPGFGDKSADNLINAIQKSKHTTLARFLFALGIRQVGEFTAKLISENFQHLEDLYNIDENRLININQLGQKIAKEITLFFNDIENLKTLDELKQLGVEIENPDHQIAQTKKGALDGLTFVITGTLSKQRKDVEALIRSQGGRVLSSLSKSTSYLIAGKDAGSKAAKAVELSVKTITYEDLLSMIEYGKP